MEPNPDKPRVDQSHFEAERLLSRLPAILAIPLMRDIQRAPIGSFWVNPSPLPEPKRAISLREAESYVDEDIDRTSKLAIELGFGWGGFPGAENHIASLRQNLMEMLNRRYIIVDSDR